MRADDVGAYEIVGTQDRTIDVRFGREIDEVSIRCRSRSARTSFSSQMSPSRTRSADCFEHSEIFDISRISEGVKNDDLPFVVRLSQ